MNMVSQLIILTVCLVGYAASSACPASLEEAYFKGECSHSSDYNWYSFSTVKNGLEKSWNLAVDTSVNSLKTEITNSIVTMESKIGSEVQKIKNAFDELAAQQSELNSTVTVTNTIKPFVEQEMGQMNETVTLLMDDQQKMIEQAYTVQNETAAVIAKLVADVAEISAQNLELKLSNQELKQAMEQLKKGGAIEVAESYRPPQGRREEQDFSNGSLVKTVCKVREALGVELTETCRQILHPLGLSQVSV